MRKDVESIEFEELGDPHLNDTDDGGQGLTQLEGDSWYGQTLEPTAAAQYRPTISELRFTRDDGEDVGDGEGDEESGSSIAQRTASIFNRPTHLETQQEAEEEVNRTKRSDSLNETSPLNNEELTAATMGARKYGIWDGVFARCLLNIFGVIMFLRLGWVVSQAGIWGAFGVILLSGLVTIISTLSLSAISSNGQVEGGGVYYMISRSLGPEIGGAIGILFSVANAVAISLYIIGFAETIVGLKWAIIFPDSPIDDVRVWGMATLVLLLIIALIGVGWVIKTQMFLLVLLIGSIVVYMLGTGTTPPNPEVGFTGYLASTIAENTGANYSPGENFFTVLAVFFPAVTGIMAGANISGDLRRPEYDIPYGTMLAVIVSIITYLVLAFMMGATSTQESLQNDPLVMINVAAWPPLVIMGVFAATLSSALASLVGAPRVFQAVAKDNLFPAITPFAKGVGEAQEPHRAYGLAFIIGGAFCLIANLNSIASLITEFFLISYLLVNWACAAASFSKSPSWRPSFPYYNRWLAVAGCIMCFGIMFLIDVITTIITFIVCGFLYKYIEFTKPAVNWGGANQAISYYRAYRAALKLRGVKHHVKNYRPQFLVMSGNPSNRPHVVQTIHFLRKGHGAAIFGNVLFNEWDKTMRRFKEARESNWLVENNIDGFMDVVTAPNLREGARLLMQTSGLGRIRPNTFAVGYKEDWNQTDDNDNPVDVNQYVGIIEDAMDMNLAVIVMRNTYKLLHELGSFRSTIDIYWLVDDGGFTILVPHILLKDSRWKKCEMRVFIRSTGNLGVEQLRMSKMLKRLRIEASTNVLEKLHLPDNKEVEQILEQEYGVEMPTEPTLLKRTKHYIALGDQIRVLSKDSSMVFITLPVPRTQNNKLYMAWLDMLSADLPPMMLLRGNQENVMTVGM